MSKDCQITVDQIARVWNEQTGMCYEVKPDDDALGMIQINVYSAGVRGSTPDIEIILMPEEAEALWTVLRDASIQARAMQKQIEEDIKNG